MSNFELYAAIYFGLGLVVSLIVVAAHLANKRKESKFSRDIMRALNPKREAFLYRVLEDVIVPTLAFFLVWLVWPVVFVLKFKDIFKKKSQEVVAESDSDLIPNRNRNRNRNSNSNSNSNFNIINTQFGNNKFNNLTSLNFLPVLYHVVSLLTTLSFQLPYSMVCGVHVLQ